jgi:hypothetical protein
VKSAARSSASGAFEVRYASLLSRSEPASGLITDLVGSSVHPKTVFLSDDLSGRSRGPGTDRCRLSPADVQGARYA